MTVEEIIKTILLIGGSSLVVKLLDMVQKWNEQKKADRKALEEKAKENFLLTHKSSIDVSQMGKEHFESIIKTLKTYADSQTERANEAIKLVSGAQKQLADERLHWDKVAAGLKMEIGEIKKLVVEEQKRRQNVEKVLKQYERNIKFLLDDFGIAYWCADNRGNCIEINETFHRLTGLPPADCLGNGWLNAVHDEDRERVAYQWKIFIANDRTHREFHFRVVNKKSGKTLEVKAMGDIIYLLGDEVYRFTVRTRPLQLEN